MDPLLAWLGKLVGTLLGGPGVAVLGDPGLDVEPPAAVSHRPSWVNRLAGLVAVLAVLLFFGTPWQLLGPIGLLGLVFVFRPRFLPL